MSLLNLRDNYVSPELGKQEIILGHLLYSSLNVTDNSEIIPAIIESQKKERPTNPY